MGKRKEAYRECCAAPKMSTVTMANAFYSEFFGVRSTKIGDPITEQQVVQFVQTNEKSFNHSVSLHICLANNAFEIKIFISISDCNNNAAWPGNGSI